MPLRRLLTLIALLPGFALADIHYTLTPEPANKSVRVTIDLDASNQADKFRIPAWCPGFYFLLNYEKKISDFRAVDPDGRPFTVVHELDPREWTVSNPQRKRMTVSYRVLGDDSGLGFFGTSVLPQTAFVNGPSAFMYVEGRTTEPVRFEVKLPEKWKIATAMDPDGDAYKAGGYDEFVDNPIQMGIFERRKFEVKGIPYEVVFVSPNQSYRPVLNDEADRLKTLSLPAIELFGGAPFKRYIYFIHLSVGDFAGGLEHRACNVMAIPNSRPLEIDDLIAHEYFHAWNVKQIRPKPLGPFDYRAPNRTDNLWFAEGVTDYYAQITAYRSGLQDKTWLINQLAGNVRGLQNSPTRKKITLAESSSQTWEHGGFGYDDLSYYTKGLLVGWIFDAVIRDATDGAKSLDDVMRLLYSRYYLPKPGYEEDALLKAINEVSGTDQSGLYKQMVESTAELPYEQLRKLGIVVNPNRWSAQIDPASDAKATRLRDAWLSRPSGVGQ